MRALFLLLSIFGVLAMPAEERQGHRGLLWQVVRACVLNHKITGAAFPCLAVDSAEGSDKGYAVLRAPDERVRVIVTPIVRTTGIESPRLRGPEAPDYFHDAWLSRHFIAEDLAKPPKRGDLALAVNSKPGRSQDQLHIHIACIRTDVRQSVSRMETTIRNRDWTPVRLLPGVPRYLVHFEPSDDLAGINVFDKVADGLKVESDHMDDVTIVVVGAEPSGFMIMARKRLPNSADDAHGEGLLDPSCANIRGKG
jgi:CDP-diacylglycerol pyrophosphatase